MKSRNKAIVFAVLVLFLLSLSAATVLANPVPPCKVGSPGYWMNHPDAWPVDEIVISNSLVISKEDAIEFMGLKGKDKSITLFRAFVAARLNQFMGCDTSCPIPGTGWTIQDLIWQADTWLFNNPPGSGVSGNSEAWQGGGEWKYEWLDRYVNGKLCVPARD
jgi:hypothetical protein